MSSILVNVHIMWYESYMINEFLNSLYDALKSSEVSVDLTICLNSQTYLEQPNIGKPFDMFSNFLKHEIITNYSFGKLNIIEKTDQDEFYNIGDFRREIYDLKSSGVVFLCPIGV